MRHLIAGVGGLALAALMSQFPEYAQQYTQRLGGAVDELRIIVEDFDRAASTAGLDRQAAIARYTASNDEFLAGRGISMVATFTRYEQLQATLNRVAGAGPIERLQLLPAYVDTDIGRRTIEHYKPAVPLTLEGLLYAGAGFLLGFALMSAVYRLLALPWCWHRHRLAARGI
ncbi:MULTISPECIES: DUF2937 family protein [unclassified Devosia]|uniref:DUF2937 family protein n=1 Tax=unclassified Devosia TaxID=196773 RepID=UPI001551C360|nr:MULTISPECIES: DUF2937 family protein [unclassified Devosia]